jgi:hypothetical protein
MNKIHLKIAAIINVGSALVHTILGQVDLVNPLLESNLSTQVKGEWVGVWHIVTIILFATSIPLLKAAFKKIENSQIDLLKFIAWLYILFALAFIVVSIWYFIFAPQWVLLLPIGLLTLIGLKKRNTP